ncbi:MAG: GNAT family N-acetyltransferase [Archaeoglobaceae archaeon]
MRIEELRKEHVRDAVRILVLSYSNEFNAVFGDIELARELMFKYFERYTSGYVAIDDRVVGFAKVSREREIGKFLRDELGFVRGLKASLLLSFIWPRAKKDEAILDFVAVSPFRRGKGIGSALLKRIIDDCDARKIRCVVAVDNDAAIGLLTKFGFEVRRMIDDRRVEKHFGRRRWFEMVREL